MSIENNNFDFSTNYQLSTTHSLTQREYKDTQREDLNRRKITINNQTGNIIDANIEFYPAKATDVDGTPITAAIMSEFHNVIEQADQNAKNSFNMANEIANRAENYFGQVSTNLNSISQKLDKIVGGVYTLANSESIFTISTGLASVKSIVFSIVLNTAGNVGRMVSITSISGGEVSCRLRSTYSGAIEGIGNATTMQASVHWQAIGN